MVAGLVWQVVSMTLFLGLWADFARRVHKARGQGAFNTTATDTFAMLRNSRKFRNLQIGKPNLHPMSLKTTSNAKNSNRSCHDTDLHPFHLSYR